MQIDLNGLISGFNWFKNKRDLSSPTKKQPRRPATQDFTEYRVANAELTKGLYHNSYPGMKLAGALAFNTISIPVNFMGLPIPVLVEEDEAMQEVINALLARFSTSMHSLHTQCHREGTIWPWPYFDSKKLLVRWQFLPDEIVTDIIVNINTRDILKIFTTEEVAYKVDYDTTEYFIRKREYTANNIVETYSGTIPEGLTDKSYRNPVSIIPIPFANNSDGDEHRGYSDFERVIPDLKDYADIDLAQSQMLAKFKVKMVQEFESDVDTWLDNNGYDSLEDVDVTNADLIMNKKDKESTSYIFPSNAHEAYEAALKRKYRKIVEGSGIPELLWGISVSGNYASSEEALETFVMFVKNKQNQKTVPYQELFKATFQLMYEAGQIAYIPEFTIKWNELSAVSEKVKSEIFASYASGMSSLMTVAGITKAQMQKLWEEMAPGITEQDFEKYKIDLSDAAKHKQFANASFNEVMDLTGNEGSDTGEVEDEL